VDSQILGDFFLDSLFFFTTLVKSILQEHVGANTTQQNPYQICNSVELWQVLNQIMEQSAAL